MKGPDIKAPASILFFPSKKTILIFYKQENDLLNEANKPAIWNLHLSKLLLH